MKKILCLSVAILFISCGNDEPPTEGEGYLAEIPTLAVEETTVFDDDDFPVVMPLRIAASNGYAVVAEGRTWKLHLLNNEGKHLHTAGGLGRGPGEFSAINQIHFGDDGLLYVYDAVNHKLTAYRIDSDQLVPDQEISLPSYGSLLSTSLKSVHVTDSGTIAVFKDLFTPVEEQDEFQVYRLSEDFEQQELLGTLPGNDFLVHNGSKRENFLGNTTKWKTNGNRLHFIQTDDMATSVLNLEDGTVRIDSVYQIPEREVTQQQMEYLEERLGPVIRSMPPLGDYMESMESLPLLMDFLPAERDTYYSMLNVSDNPGFLLVYDRTTGEMGKIQVPPMFNVYAADGNKIYGIDYSDQSHHKLMVLERSSR